MKIIVLLTLIALSSISIFWYTEVATPYQKEFTHNKAKQYGDVLAEKSKDAGSVVLKKGKEIYEDRDQYIQQATDMSEPITKKIKVVIKSMRKEEP